MKQAELKKNKDIMEEWRAVKGFEGAYEISNLGNLRSIDRNSLGKRYFGKLISNAQDRGGYLVNILSYEGKRQTVRRHRLVAEAFIPNAERKPEVNHIDGDKTNNQVSNLEWATHRENTDHAWITGLTKAPPAQIPIEVIQIYEGSEIATYKSIEIAGWINGISPEDICKYCKGKRKNAGRYIWKYKENQ